MLIKTWQALIQRDLKKMYTEIESYQNEKNIRHYEKGINNLAGNFCLHLIDNLNTNIGAQFGKTNNNRNSDQEFSLKNMPTIELLKVIQSTYNQPRFLDY